MKLTQNRRFWIIPIIFALVGILHYSELVGISGAVYPSIHFGLTRHSLDRMLFLIPIVYSCFLLGRKGVLITTLIALSLMLPRAILISPAPRDAAVETAAILGVGLLASWGIWTRAEERDKTRAALAELESAHDILQHYMQSVERNEQRQTIINTISNLLGESLDLERVLKRATHMVSELMETEIALIFSADEASQELHLVACEGVSDDFARALNTVGIDEGFYGEVAKTSQPLVVDDTSQDTKFALPKISDMQIQTQLIVPMIIKDKVRGVLCVAARRPRQFTLDNIEMLTAVGTQIAAAMENARLYEKERLAAQRLAISERNYRQLFEGASDAIWVHDLEGHITATNEAAGKLVGYSTEAMKRMNVEAFLSDESLKLSRQVRRKLLAKKPVEQPYEQNLARKDGSETILLVSTNLVTANGEPVGFQHIARDITEERKRQDSLHHYLSQITQVQEEERKRVARDLHDDTSQALYALSRQVDNFTRDNTGLAPNADAFLKKLRQQLNSTLEGIRRFTQELRPPILDDLGLLPALRWQVNDFAKQTGIETDSAISGTERRFSAEVELTIFRIVQEALRNVSKHAQASKVEVKIKFGRVKTKISIDDNGKGFDLRESLADLPRDGKLGLAGMEERVHLLNGKMRITSESGKGTGVMIELPM